MKTMKKLASVALALTLALALAVPALATEVKITNRDILNGTDHNETYTAYKVFDVTIGEGDEATAPHSYTISKDSPFLSTIQDFKIKVDDPENEGEKIEINAFTLTQVGDIYNVAFNGDYNDSVFAANLAAELNGVADKDSEIIASTNKQTDGVYTLNIPDEGYYFITSTLGSKIIVDTVGKDELKIQSKNDYPTLDKTIESIVNGTVAEGGKSGTAAYGSTVTFDLTVTIPATAAGEMIVHDVMDSNLTYVDLANGSFAAAVREGTEEAGEDVTVCTKEFVISAEQVAANLGETVTIKYTATLNSDAPIDTAIKNIAHLTYSNYETPKYETEVYTCEFDLIKTTSENVILNGAKFDLFKVVNGEDVLVEDDIEVGTATISGLSAGNYKLVETEAPTGYNKLKDPVTFEIKVKTEGETEGGSLKATLSADETAWVEGGVHVVNLTGAELPAAGGIGTTLFYIGGGILVAGAGILLITKKRMGAEEE